MEQNYTTDNRLDQLTELEQEAQERGFESIDEMQQYDEEAYLRYRDLEVA